MYKYIVRKSIRQNLDRLSAGDASAPMAKFQPDAKLLIPGGNSWAMQHGGPRDPYVATQNGKSQIEELVARYRDEGWKMTVRDILVNGPPWAMRAAVRIDHDVPAKAGAQGFRSPGMMFFTAKWGKIVTQENFEDTELIADYEAHQDKAS